MDQVNNCKKRVSNLIAFFVQNYYSWKFNLISSISKKFWQKVNFDFSKGMVVKCLVIRFPNKRENETWLIFKNFVKKEKNWKLNLIEIKLSLLVDDWYWWQFVV